jgi:hypothetical protein
MTIDQAYHIVQSCDRTIRGAFAVWIETTNERMFVPEHECRILAILSDDLKFGRLQRFQAREALLPQPTTSEQGD